MRLSKCTSTPVHCDAPNNALLLLLCHTAYAAVRMHHYACTLRCPEQCTLIASGPYRVCGCQNAPLRLYIAMPRTMHSYCFWAIPRMRLSKCTSTPVHCDAPNNALLLLLCHTAYAAVKMHHYACTLRCPEPCTLIASRPYRV